MSKTLLIINAGSSSIKFARYTVNGCGLSEGLHGQVEGIGNQPRFKANDKHGNVLADNLLPKSGAFEYKDCLALIYSWLEDHVADGAILAVGHRVVHGGVKYTAPVLVDNAVLSDLDQLTPLAALHQPHNLAAIRALKELLPGIPQVACFDTAFHQSQPEIAKYYGLPKRFFEAGIQHYGFHGLSYEHLARILPELDPKLSNARIIAAHLGSGASLCAIRDGQSIATTMGFSVLDGLIMGTRCGSLDPGVILHLLADYKMQPGEVEHLLYHESGLLGVSGLSNDMKTLLSSENENAKRAVELFCYRAGREIGSLAAALGGLDALVFTGGIGENSPEIRQLICRQAAWLGVNLNDEANNAASRLISSTESSVSAWVVPANENFIIASHTQKLVASC